MSATTDYGPLAEWISERKALTAPEFKKEERPLPCEQGESACPSPWPVLSAEVFSASVLWKRRRRVPRFGLYDPNMHDSECRFYPHGAILGGHVSIDTGLTSRIDWIGVQVCSAVFGGVAAVMAVVGAIANDCPWRGGWPIFALVALVGAVLFWMSRGQDEILVSTFTGPIPPAIRREARVLDRPLVVAPARWEVAPAPLYRDPYLVTACGAGGRLHFHVHARWDVKGDEVLVEEFMRPAHDDRPLPREAS